MDIPLHKIDAYPSVTFDKLSKLKYIIGLLIFCNLEILVQVDKQSETQLRVASLKNV